MSPLPAGGQAPAYALTPIRVDVIAGHVHRGIALAEGGYTESDDKPLGKVHSGTRGATGQWSLQFGA